MKKKNSLTILAIVVTCLLPLGKNAAAREKKVNQKILDLLLDKKIVTEKQYRELSREVKEEAKKGFSLEYNKKLHLNSNDNKLKLTLNGRVLNDAVFFLDNHPADDNFTTRQLWLTLKGRVYEHFGFVVQPDFTAAGRFQDATVDLFNGPGLHFRIGQLKPPVSMEFETPFKSRDFVFPPLVVFTLSPLRDRGALVQGKVADNKLFYAAGIMNGSRVGANDGDKHKDLVGRLVYSPGGGLHLGGCLTYGRQNLTMDDRDVWWNRGRWTSPLSGVNFFELRDNVIHNGDRLRYGLEGAWIKGPLSLKGEWLHVRMDDLSVGDTRGSFDSYGYYLSLACTLTGEEQPFNGKTYGPVTPRDNFDPEKNHWGAFQLVARFSRINLDRQLLTRGFSSNAAQQTNGASEYGIGCNWALNEFLRFMVDYIHIRFDSRVVSDGRNIEDENILATRFQATF